MTGPEGREDRPPAERGGRGWPRLTVNAAWWAPLVLYSAAIFRASAGKAPVDLPDRFPHADKVFHFGAYVLWALLLAAPLWRCRRRLSRAAFVVVVAAAGALYGATDEFHQFFVPGREADLADLAADAAGALAGALLWISVARRR